MITHPGSVRFIDGDTGTVVAVTPISELPEHNCWAPLARGRAPVLEVIAYDGGRRIDELGPGHVLLRTTTTRDP